MSGMMRDEYGVLYENALEDVGLTVDFLGQDDPDVYWDDPELAKVVRLRLLSDPGFPYWDLSYCWGILRDGTHCRVVLPFHQLGKRGWKAELIEYAKRDGVFAKGLGFFDPDVRSTLQ